MVAGSKLTYLNARALPDFRSDRKC
jgi:hypothetical protein